MTASSTSGPPRRRRTARRAARDAARSSQRLTGPADLVQAVPYLLGFHPSASLVLVGLADGHLAVTARLDLADATHHATVLHTIAAMRGGGAESLVAICFDDSAALPAAAESSAVQDVVAAAAGDADRVLLDVLVVARGRWRSRSCADPVCCPADGTPLPQAPSAFAAAATVDGVVALADRGALERLLAPEPDEVRERLRRRLTAAPDVAERARGPRDAASELFAAARASDGGWARGAPSDADVVRFAAALRATEVRDAVWMAIDERRLDGRELWRELARRAPAPYDAAPLFLHGWASWRAGDGALANIAATQAVAGDPTYSAADLLLAALSHGIDPRTFPPLHGPRTA